MTEQDGDSKKFLSTGRHCTGCDKLALAGELSLFVIAFWSGADPKTGEPIIRDGIFDDQGKLALLRACPACGPWIVKLHKEYAWAKLGDHLATLRDGPLKKMLRQIWPRRRPDWRLEIGWQMLVPLMAGVRDSKLRKLSDIRREDEQVERMKFRRKS